MLIQINPLKSLKEKKEHKKEITRQNSCYCHCTMTGDRSKRIIERKNESVFQCPYRHKKKRTDVLISNEVHFKMSDILKFFWIILNSMLITKLNKMKAK